jgi:pimeloyl-[acyl-carrier protein] methyl ester esterase
MQFVSLPGWLFSPASFAPLRRICRGPMDWTCMPWEAALEPDRLRAAVASAPSPCWVVAWSLGTLAALRLAADPPPTLAGLVLFGATARLPADPATGYAGVAPAALSAMRRRLERDSAGLFRDFHAICHRPDSATDAETAAFVQNALSQDAATVDAGLASLATLDLRDRLASIELPVALLHGEADAVVPVSQAHALAAALPRGRVVTLPRRGHVPDADLFGAAGDVLSRGAPEHDDGGL